MGITKPLPTAECCPQNSFEEGHVIAFMRHGRDEFIPKPDGTCLKSSLEKALWMNGVGLGSVGKLCSDRGRCDAKGMMESSHTIAQSTPHGIYGTKPRENQRGSYVSVIKYFPDAENQKYRKTHWNATNTSKTRMSVCDGLFTSCTNSIIVTPLS